MGNTQASYDSSLFLFCRNTNANSCQQSLHMATHSLSPRSGNDVFINHRGVDMKETVASLIYHNLQNKGLRVFLDNNSVHVGERIPESIEQAIRTASVHIAIFSPNYADSEWCLNELDLILKTGAPIIPLFGGIRPSELRMEDKDGAYVRAFQSHKQAGKIKARTLQRWKNALLNVSYIEGYIFKGDQGELLERIAASATKYISSAK